MTSDDGLRHDGDSLLATPNNTLLLPDCLGRWGCRGVVGAMPPARGSTPAPRPKSGGYGYKRSGLAIELIPILFEAAQKKAWWAEA